MYVLPVSMFLYLLQQITGEENRSSNRESLVENNDEYPMTFSNSSDNPSSIIIIEEPEENEYFHNDDSNHKLDFGEKKSIIGVRTTSS